MKKFLTVLIVGLNLILLHSCAKPTVVNVVLPEDKKLNCEKLEDALIGAQKFRSEAMKVIGNTAGNQVRAVLFWPALATTYVNAHEAIVAASERSVHIINIMLDKDCKAVDKHLRKFQTTLRVQTLKDLSEAYGKLNELYKSGGLTEKEYDIHKHKILGQ